MRQRSLHQRWSIDKTQDPVGEDQRLLPKSPVWYFWMQGDVANPLSGQSQVLATEYQDFQRGAGFNHH